MKKGNRTFHFRFFIGIFLVLLALCASSYRKYRLQNVSFVYADHLGDPVMTIDEKPVTLREFGCYIFEVEAFFQRQAYAYNPKNLTQYWNTHFSVCEKSTFLYDYAQKIALNNAAADYIYAEMAESSGMESGIVDLNHAKNRADRICTMITPEQWNATGLTPGLILQVKKRSTLAARFAKEYAKTADFSNYFGNTGELMGGNGDFFQNEILPKHKVVYNEELLKKVRLGTITVNIGDTNYFKIWGEKKAKK